MAKCACSGGVVDRFALEGGEEVDNIAAVEVEPLDCAGNANGEDEGGEDETCGVREACKE